ncbi:hypothetical protein [Mycobacterium sp. NPDC006124]|uniref:hypothetical protein n=1 Tax=Mycobacterium sp. NPDC006124 TaxID=3156729 RepID=UPI0033B235B7
MTEPTTEVAAAAQALATLRTTRPELADALARVARAIADEAVRSPGFAGALTTALSPTAIAGVSAVSEAVCSASTPAKRSRRREPGVVDPFAVYRDSEEGGLRASLGELDVEQLKDIIAEHGMDHDRLAMRWKTPKKLVDRIVEKVVAGAAKGSAFR